MQTYTVELPQDLSDYVKARVASGEFISESEFFCHCIRSSPDFKKLYNIHPDAEVITRGYLSRNTDIILTSCQQKDFCIIEDGKPIGYLVSMEKYKRLESIQKDQELT